MIGSYRCGSVFFSGIAFIGIALTLFLQGRELQNQREELTITREEQQRSSEIAMRQLHTDLIKMAISDRELREVWPPIAPGVARDEERPLLQPHPQPAEGGVRGPHDRTRRASRRAPEPHDQPRHVRLLAESACGTRHRDWWR